MKNADMPAAPITDAIDTHQSWEDLTAGGRFIPANGLTKREHFAGLAMQNIMGKYNPFEYGDFDSSDYETVAKHCIGLADALLKQLEQSEGE